MSESDDLLEMLLDQFDKLCADLIDRDLLAAAERGSRPERLVSAVEELGVMDALGLPGDDGALPVSAAGAILAMLGARAVPLPVGETMLARWILGAAGISVPEGFVGLVDPASSLPHFALVGHIVAQIDGELMLFDAAALSTAACQGIARQGRHRIDLAAATPVVRAAWPANLPPLSELGALMRASQIAGGLAQVLALTVDYANTRKQFGRPIGRFQAVQQLVAKLAAEAAVARAVSDAGWFAIENGKPGLHCAIAKVRAGEAARIGAALAHQVHGAIGVTDEHILHHHTRRLWEWRLEFGSDGLWAARLGAAARQAPGGLWNLLTGRDDTALSSPSKPVEALA